MKKLLFVAFIGALVACGEATTETTTTDTPVAAVTADSPVAPVDSPVAPVDSPAAHVDSPAVAK
ncbi:MAG TPA: hypothetical protein VLC98_01835 [Phnomibacter sp.]|nr:hypothetical protein [Phnomibacter sp.]